MNKIFRQIFGGAGSILLCGLLFCPLFMMRVPAEERHREVLRNRVEMVIRELGGEFSNQPWQEALTVDGKIFFPLKQEQMILNAGLPEQEVLEPFRFVTGYVFPLSINNRLYWFLFSSSGELRRFSVMEKGEISLAPKEKLQKELEKEAVAYYQNARKELMMKVYENGF